MSDRPPTLPYESNRTKWGPRWFDATLLFLAAGALVVWGMRDRTEFSGCFEFVVAVWCLAAGVVQLLRRERSKN